MKWRACIRAWILPNSIRPGANPAAQGLGLIGIAAFGAGLGPLLWLIWQFFFGNGLGANPIQYVIRDTGEWTLRFLCLVLFLTPLGVVSGWFWAFGLRKMIGLFALFYASLHLMSWVGLDLFFDWPSIWRELIKRTFLWVGMIGFVLLLPLGVTSIKSIAAKLNPKIWGWLHRLTYVVAGLGILHFWMMTKSDFSRPTFYIIILAGLVLARLWIWRTSTKSASKITD